MSEKKKKVLVVSDFSKSKTGFGRHARELLMHLYGTDKYDLVEYCMAPFRWNDTNAQYMPWTCHGCMPDDDNQMRQAADDPNARYGGLYIDRIIREQKPDVAFFIQDPWAFPDYWYKPWWNKFTCVFWPPLDSLPIIKMAHENADKIKHYWVWADFGRKALHEMGYTHVKTVHGMLDPKQFYPLEESERLDFRRENYILDDEIIIGFVFRNQLRKLAWRLIEALSIFKKKHPDKKVKLLFHTYWEEGWKLQDFIDEFEVEQTDVLTTYLCGHCRHTMLSPYYGQGIECPKCQQKTMVNPRTVFGCTEAQLNQVYNAMDAYAHPMTSGGCEMPNVEAMLAGLPVATVPYSCGTEFTDQEFVYPLGYTEYREMASTFKKAHVNVEPIVEYMEYICDLDPKERDRISKAGREWAQQEYSPEIIGKFVEDFIDEQPFADYDFEFDSNKYNPDYPLITEEEMPDNLKWAIDIYKGIFNRHENAESESVRSAIQALDRGRSREDVHEELTGKARDANAESEQRNYADHFEDNGKKRLVYVMPESFGDCLMSLGILDEIRKAYPEDEWDMYVATKPEYTVIFTHLKYIKNILPYDQRMDSYQWWEGCGDQKGLVDIAFLPFVLTQRWSCYTHNGEDINVLQDEYRDTFLWCK